MSRRTAPGPARTGNLFADFGFPSVEAENLLLRSRLMSEIRKVARGHSKARAARRLGIPPARLDELLRGQIDEFNIDALINMLSEAGMRVELRVKKNGARGSPRLAPGP
jgi:predicted XRE-type DNA-binding protein